MTYICQTAVCTIDHESVVIAAVQEVSQGVVVAVLLRPLFGRTARRQVLREVARGVQTQRPQCDVWVVADMDIYQAVSAGVSIDLSRLEKRPSCVHLAAT